jgi:nicotinamidase-related amidase
MPRDHGSFPHRAKSALLLIDVINDLDFPEAEKLLEQAIPMTKSLLELKHRTKRHRIPSIYVNDNFGQWKSDFRQIFKHCTGRGVRGATISKRLRPEPDDYFVLKPKHSGFYSTTLDLLLEYLHVDTLILSGIATNICVFFTANDAYMRDYSLYVPRDCVAANSADESDYALSEMNKVLKADIRPSNEIDLKKLALAPASHRTSSGHHRTSVSRPKSKRR